MEHGEAFTIIEPHNCIMKYSIGWSTTTPSLSGLMWNTCKEAVYLKNDQKITLDSSFALSTLIVLLIALYPSYSSWFVTIFFLRFALIYTFEKEQIFKTNCYYLLSIIYCCVCLQHNKQHVIILPPKAGLFFITLQQLLSRLCLWC